MKSALRVGQRKRERERKKLELKGEGGGGGAGGGKYSSSTGDAANKVSHEVDVGSAARRWFAPLRLRGEQRLQAARDGFLKVCVVCQPAWSQHNSRLNARALCIEKVN